MNVRCVDKTCYAQSVALHWIFISCFFTGTNRIAKVSLQSEQCNFLNKMFDVFLKDNFNDFFRKSNCPCDINTSFACCVWLPRPYSLCGLRRSAYKVQRVICVGVMCRNFSIWIHTCNTNTYHEVLMNVKKWKIAYHSSKFNW